MCVFNLNIRFLQCFKEKYSLYKIPLENSMDLLEHTTYTATFYIMFKMKDIFTLKID